MRYWIGSGPFEEEPRRPQATEAVAYLGLLTRKFGSFPEGCEVGCGCPDRNDPSVVEVYVDFNENDPIQFTFAEMIQDGVAVWDTISLYELELK